MHPTETLIVTLTSEQLREVRQSVEAGEYASINDVLRDAMRFWQRRRQDDAERLDVIRDRIRRSLDDPRPGLTPEQVDGHLEELFARAAKDPRFAHCVDQPRDEA